MQNSMRWPRRWRTHFAATPETALPAAVFSVWYTPPVLLMFFRQAKNGGQASCAVDAQAVGREY